MKILYVASESFPFIKMGESADVAYSLPKAISKNEDIDMRVILPYFSQIPKEYTAYFKNIGKGTFKLGWREVEFSVEHLNHEGVDYYFIRNDYYFDRDKIFGESDDGERFAFFSKAVIYSLNIIKFTPDIIHCNGVTSALIPLFLKELREDKKLEKQFKNLKKIKTLFTIHSLKYQGIVNRDALLDILNLDPEEYFTESSLKFYDSISFIKAGITYSDAISTVSPTYASELLTEEYAGALAGLFQFYRKKLIGIRNGIDTELFDPKRDKELFYNYGYTTIEKRKENKLLLQEELGLHQDAEIPLITIISKLNDERGIELIKDRIDAILTEKVELIVVGNGDEKYEDLFDYYSHIYYDKVFTKSFGDESLTKKILSAADIVLIPSKTEPCGLIQMLALRYGAVPVARATGGIKETVSNENGFLFEDFNSDEMMKALREALDCYHNNRERWNQIVEKGMRARNFWTSPVKKYIDLYKKIAK